MRIATVGMVLRVAGLIVGLAAIAAIVMRVDVTHLSPFFVKVAIYKLTFIAALVLLVAGAVLGRRARARRVPPMPPR
jgi:hypothetical protein